MGISTMGMSLMGVGHGSKDKNNYYENGLDNAKKFKKKKNV